MHDPHAPHIGDNPHRDATGRWRYLRGVHESQAHLTTHTFDVRAGERVACHRCGARILATGITKPGSPHAWHLACW